jgi:uncharacterized membrane protein YphA (DoxX/SURF4 family)
MSAAMHHVSMEDILMECYRYETRRFFLCGMGLFFGVWLLYVGLVKWLIMGPTGFVGYITTEFDRSWSPHLLNVLLAWLIMTMEPVLAALLLSGRKPRMVWTLTALLMFLLTMGQTILMKPDVIANWQYLVLTLTCAALSAPEGEEKSEQALHGKDDPPHGTRPLACTRGQVES